jgi:hypothetical protein
MKPSTLKPGDKVKVRGHFTTDLRDMTFVRREKWCTTPTARRSEYVFQCDAYRGLFSPDDNGTVAMSQYEVSHNCTLANQ